MLPVVSKPTRSTATVITSGVSRSYGTSSCAALRAGLRRTLIAGKFGSRHFGTKPYLAEAVRLTGTDGPIALYVGAASADDRGFGTALSALLKGAGIRKVVWPKLSSGKKKDASGARAALGDVDLVFVGGGDVEAGVQALRDADLI